MKLIDLIPYLKNSDKWQELLGGFGIDGNSEEILIYALDTLHIESELLLIEAEKTGDNLVIELNGKKYIQILPTSLAKELITIDFLNLKTDLEIAQRLIEFRIKDFLACS
jgi:hypothetical protein